MLVIRTGRIEIASGTGPLTATEMVWFPNDVIGECWVGLAGYNATYSSGDHELKALEVRLKCGAQKTEFGIGVAVTATLLLRDKNGDDPFEGWVDFVLFVELKHAFPNTNIGSVDLHLTIR
jgi:hypothetical protein